jgi:hypothetical protein
MPAAERGISVHELIWLVKYWAPPFEVATLTLTEAKLQKTLQEMKINVDTQFHRSEALL